MPTAKKKSAKKQKGKIRTQIPVAANEQQGGSASPRNKMDFPVFQSNAEQQRLNNNNNDHQPFDSLYIRYKRATRDFKQAMKNLVPAEIYEDTAGGLVRAAEYVADHLTSVDQTIMDDLKLAIRVRRRVASSAYGGGDMGHSNFIVALTHCWACLRLLQRSKKSRPASETAKREDKYTLENRFAALAVEEDDSSDDDDEEDLPSSMVNLPPFDKTPHASTVPLLNEVRIDAILFLMTLDECMENASLQFRGLKEAYLDGQRSGRPDTTIIQQLMQATTVVNFSIQQVATVEHELVTDHEQLSTVYRLLAVVVGSDAIHDLCKLVQQISPQAKEFTEVDAAAFFGDAMECGFRNPSDPDNRIKNLDDDFCSKWHIRIEDLQSIGMYTARIAAISSLQVELKENAELHALLAAEGSPTRPWLPVVFIGGTERPITHTIRLLQETSNAIENKSFCQPPRPGFFGEPWDETRNMAKTIAKDFDSLLLGDVLPHLLSMCSSGMLSTSLPYENELLPLFVHLRKFVKNPRKPISWTLAFSVHAVLTSIYDVQGENCVGRLGDIARAAFQLFMDQLQNCINRVDMVPTTKAWKHNLGIMHQLRWLVATPIQGTPESEYRALWNPMCAGTFLGCLAYFVNLDFGSAMVDSSKQLSIVLHLFNGLVRHGLFPRGELPILDLLHSRFANCKAVWEGPLPERGEFVKRFWIVYGFSIPLAISKSEQTKAHWRQSGSAADLMSNGRITKVDSRSVTPIKPEALATSYRRICLHDFTSAVDKYHSPEEKQRLGGDILYKHAVHVNDTLDWMMADQVLLAMNLTCFGATLNEFVHSLCTVLEWKPLVKQIVREDRAARRAANSRRVASNSLDDDDGKLSEWHALVHLIVEHILAELDFNTAPNQMSPPVLKTAQFLKVYFSHLEPHWIMWFTPTQSEEESRNRIDALHE
jgi:hypothetical protein